MQINLRGKTLWRPSRRNTILLTQTCRNTYETTSAISNKLSISASTSERFAEIRLRIECTANRSNNFYAEFTLSADLEKGLAAVDAEEPTNLKIAESQRQLETT